MSINKSDYHVETLEREIDELFEAVYDKVGPEECYKTLLRVLPFPDIYNTGYFGPVTDVIDPLSRSILDNCIHLTSLIKSIEELGSVKMADHLVHLKLLVYLQVMETKYIHIVLGNCIKVISGDEYDGGMYDNIFKNIELFEDNEDLSKELNFDLIKYKCLTKWFYMKNRFLRNVIAHNDYYYDSNSKVAIVSSSFAKGIKEGNLLHGATYSQEQIELYYYCASSFNSAFDSEITKWVLICSRNIK